MTPNYRTEELSERTWPDFEKLFSGGGGWDFCWCMAHQRGRHPSRQEFRTRAEVSVQNHQLKKKLVQQGQAHGILVYADDEPVGWCQYGSSDELVGFLNSPQQDRDLWRITCFVVHKKYRRKGVAGLALHAALDAIRARGGGLVEAYPVAGWTHGKEASPGPVNVQGVGLVGRVWGQNRYTGTVSMFEREGFQAVGVCGSASRRIRDEGAAGDHVVMRKTV
jgi:GNAT superfamily N-acetyltransferase